MKKIPCLLMGCFGVHLLFACTTFCINRNGQLVFGRNYDWVTGGGIVNTNQRGLFKTSVKASGGNTISWVSRYGSITFNQYGKEFPTGGMNEKGLVVELMWLEGTKYPYRDNRPAIGVLQWIQYQLDNAATTAEVVASDEQLRITERTAPLHFLVADAGGKVAAIEFLDGKLTVHQGTELPFPVLTNDTYRSSATTASSVLQKGESIYPGNNSLDRFVTACRMVERINSSNTAMPATTYAFSILDSVAQGSFTKWSIVYDISNREIHFKTESNKSIKTLRFSAFDMACTKPAKMFNMNQDGSGDISGRFILPDKKIKREVMDLVVLESNDRMPISQKEKESLLRYEETVICRQEK